MTDVHHDTTPVSLDARGRGAGMDHHALRRECITQNRGQIRILARQQLCAALHERDVHPEACEHLSEFDTHLAAAEVTCTVDGQVVSSGELLFAIVDSSEVD